jgi:hypothetical protein
MKKFTLLFATLLAMSGMAFGQKEGKLLWEIDSLTPNRSDNKSYLRTLISPNYNYFNTNTNAPLISPSGNIMVKCLRVETGPSTPYGIDHPEVKVFDKNGKLLWVDTDYYKKYDNNLRIRQEGKFTFLERFMDSTFCFNENFELVKKIAYRNGDYLTAAEDGFLYIQQNALIKYNQDGKEEWRYERPNLVDIRSHYSYLNRVYYDQSNYAIRYYSPPYILVTTTQSNKKNIIILDKDGKKINEIEKPLDINTNNLVSSSFHVQPTADKGFWYMNFVTFSKALYVKFDSTGKETGRYFKEGRGLFNEIVLEDNSILASLQGGSYTGNNNELPEIIKISPKGDVLKYTIPLSKTPFDYASNPNLQVVPSRKSIVFNLVYQPDANGGYKAEIGVINLDDFKPIWTKTIDAGLTNSTKGSQILFGKDNTFFQSLSVNDSNFQKFRVYDFDGNLKWESSFSVPTPDYAGRLTWRIVENNLYCNNGNELTKIRYTDGKILWTKQGIKLQQFKDYCIKIDQPDHEVIVYRDYSKERSFKMMVLNPDGSEKLKFDIPDDENRISVQPNVDHVPTIDFTLSDKKELIILSYNINLVYNSSVFSGITTRVILRKILLCNDLNGISITANKTEVCTGTKVKLSTTKQDGLTYQWQKDGKDIPIFKDVVHDVEESGNYTVTVKDEVCQNQTTSNPIKVTIKPLPEAIISTDIKGVVYEPFTAKMSANTGTGLSYQWLKDDAIIPSETTVNYEAKKSGKYNVSVSKDGCTKLSDALTISILIPLANQEEVGEEVVQIYPNPNKGEFKIILPKSLKSADIQLFDSYGRERMLTYKGEQAQAEGLVIGAYFLRVSKDGKTVTSKLIIE